MSREDMNEQRLAHVMSFVLTVDIEYELGANRRGRAMYARPRKGESAWVRIPDIKGQMTYFVALHELGHVLSPGNRYMRSLESEADAWRWALANTEEEPTIATLRGIKRRLTSYIARAQRWGGMHMPGRDSDFYALVVWLDEVAP